jgi:alpha-tubulin suppressor-like RCC1 family protein
VPSRCFFPCWAQRGLTASGAAWCWGSNQFGNLGLGTQDTEPHSTPVHAASGLTFSVIAPGLRRTCGLTTGGVVQCWGEGQLTPAAFDATSGYTELDAGQVHFCRVDGSDIVSCWGDWNLGNVPLEPAIGVGVGSRHACARLVTMGKVACWGGNDIGQLGDGENSSAGPVEPLGQP